MEGIHRNGETAAPIDQRHPRPVEDRGRSVERRDRSICCPRQIAEDVRAMLAQRAASKGIDLRMNCDPAAPETIVYRSGAIAADSRQSGGQRRQVHRTRARLNRNCAAKRMSNADCRMPNVETLIRRSTFDIRHCASTSQTPVSASRRTRLQCCSGLSPKLTHR